MELLSPAGGPAQLEAALHFGADAVYLGAPHFGLRVRAENFHSSDFPALAEKVHRAGKRIYLTANALLHPGEEESFKQVIREADDAGFDAVIVADLGAFPLVRSVSTRLAIHASTQLSCTNTAAAETLVSLGAKRIVLARELRLDEIAEIREGLPEDVELEVFVHGAMCMAYSGRCLISHYLVGRDANRGHCTQPCRWSYALEESKRPGEYFPVEEDGRHSFIMSSADLCMLEHIDELRAAGVNSLKIEGRVKGAAYVATVTNAYRRVIDGENPQGCVKELDTVSHRPYHTGFYYGTPAQSFEGEEYERTCDFIGIVETCEAQGQEFRISFVLKNPLGKGDEVEVLQPGKNGIAVQADELQDEDGMPVRIADRTQHRYLMICTQEMNRGDLLRKRKG